MKLKKLSLFGMAGTSIMLFSSYAAATNAVEWENVTDSTSGTIFEEIPAPPPYQYALTDTFAGPATLSKTCFGIPITLNCTLTVGGRLWQRDETPDYQNITLDVISATSTGGGGGIVTCPDVTFSNFPWRGTAAHNLLPTGPNDDMTVTPFNISGIQVNTPCGSCSGNVAATYTNNGGGTFAFNGTLPGSLGSCSVSSSSITGDHYNVWHP